MKLVFMYLYMHCQWAYDFSNEFYIEDSLRVQKLQHCTPTYLYIMENAYVLSAVVNVSREC